MYGLSARIIRRRDEKAEREFKDLTSRINWILSIPELADPLFQRWFNKETPHGGTGRSERAVLVCSGDTMSILIPENEDADFFFHRCLVPTLLKDVEADKADDLVWFPDDGDLQEGVPDFCRKFKCWLEVRYGNFGACRQYELWNDEGSPLKVLGTTGPDATSDEIDVHSDKFAKEMAEGEAMLAVQFGKVPELLF